MPHGSGIGIDAAGCHVSNPTYEQINAWHQGYTSTELLSAFMPPTSSYPQMKVSIGTTSYLDILVLKLCRYLDDNVMMVMTWQEMGGSSMASLMTNQQQSEATSSYQHQQEQSSSRNESASYDQSTQMQHSVHGNE